MKKLLSITFLAAGLMFSTGAMANWGATPFVLINQVPVAGNQNVFQCNYASWWTWNGSALWHMVFAQHTTYANIWAGCPKSL